VITAKAIVDAAGAAGIKVTERQLQRWREARLLPLGRQRSHGRGRGTSWVFPPETVGRVIMIAPMAQTGLSLIEIGIALWLRGAEFEEVHVRDWHGLRLQRSGDFIASADPEEVGENFAERLAHGSAVERRRYNVTSAPGGYDHVQEGVADVFRSLQGPTAALTDSAMAIMIGTLGLTPANIEGMAAAGLDIRRETSAAMETTSGLGRFALEASWEELLIARRFARILDVVVNIQRLQAPEERHPLGTFVVEFEKKMPIFGADGLVWIVGAIRQAVRNLGLEDVTKNLDNLEAMIRKAQAGDDGRPNAG
jgi:hypothetical protein